MSVRVVIPEDNESIADFAERVARSGERIVVERGGAGIAAIVPMEDLARLEESDASSRTERQRLLDDLVRMDDEAGLYAREAEAAARRHR